jgi:acetyl esterase
VPTPQLDPQIEAILVQAGAAPPIETLTPDEARAASANAYRAQFGSVDEVFSAEDADADGVPVRIYRPVETGEPSPALVYFHGGGWVTGNLDTHDGIARALAKRTPCVVVAVDYRLAPEHPYPAAIDDAWTATRWASGHAQELQLDPQRIAVGGDSAGGTLAAVVAGKARDAGLPIAAQLLIYPVTNHAFDTPSYSDFESGYGLTRGGMQWYWTHYLGARENGDEPEVSPLRLADAGGLPRAVVVTAELDVLRDEGEAYADRLSAAGVETERRRYDGLVHGFLRMAGVVDRSQEALTEIAALLRNALA